MPRSQQPARATWSQQVIIVRRPVHFYYVPPCLVLPLRKKCEFWAKLRCGGGVVLGLDWWPSLGAHHHTRRGGRPCCCSGSAHSGATPRRRRRQHFIGESRLSQSFAAAVVGSTGDARSNFLPPKGRVGERERGREQRRCRRRVALAVRPRSSVLHLCERCDFLSQCAPLSAYRNARSTRPLDAVLEDTASESCEPQVHLVAATIFSRVGTLLRNEEMKAALLSCTMRGGE